MIEDRRSTLVASIGKSCEKQLHASKIGEHGLRFFLAHLQPTELLLQAAFLNINKNMETSD